MKISIITINYNNAAGLKQTIDSVVDQTYENIEYIVIDGGSMDGSVDFIKGKESKIKYWISEKDAGIYDAMNKGIEAATGEYLLFLNSGDILINPSIVSFFLNEIKDNETDIIYGNLITVDHLGREELRSYPNKLSFNYFIYQSLPHPATLINKRLFEKYGLYDSSLKICSDWKFFVLMLCKNNCTYAHLDIAIAKYGTEGISANIKMVRAEQALVFKKEFPAFINDYLKLEELTAFYKKINTSRVVRLLAKIGFIKKNEPKENHPFKIND